MPTNYLHHPGPPNGSEVWEVGQSCIDTNGAEWVCTARGSANQPGTAFLLCSEPDTIEFSGGDLTGTVAAPTIAHIAGNNSTANFIIANVPIPASGQTIITSASIGAGTWLVACTVSASVNAVLGSNAQEIALVPHGGAASVAYASAILGGDLAKTEASAHCGTVVQVAALTQIDVVGYAGATSQWTALATTSGNSYGKATGLIAVPTV